jgi:hypothetical protein
MYTHAHTRTHTQARTRKHAGMHAHAHAQARTHTHARRHARRQARTHTHARTPWQRAGCPLPSGPRPQRPPNPWAAPSAAPPAIKRGPEARLTPPLASLGSGSEPAAHHPPYSASYPGCPALAAGPGALAVAPAAPPPPPAPPGSALRLSPLSSPFLRHGRAALLCGEALGAYDTRGRLCAAPSPPPCSAPSCSSRATPPDGRRLHGGGRCVALVGLDWEASGWGGGLGGGWVGGGTVLSPHTHAACSPHTHAAASGGARRRSQTGSPRGLTPHPTHHAPMRRGGRPTAALLEARGAGPLPSCYGDGSHPARRTPPMLL